MKASRHEYSTIQDGRINTAVSVDTDWDREHNAWSARDDLGRVTIGKPEETRHGVALRAFLGRLGLSTNGAPAEHESDTKAGA